MKSNNNDDIIKGSEKAFNKFNDDINLLKPLHELKIVYCKALQKIMLEKKGRGENFEEEYKKYETIIEVEKFNNEYKDFIDTIKQNSNSNNKINEERKSSNLKYDSEPKKISLEVIKKYLRILKQLNKKMYKSDILLSKEDCKL